MRVSTGAGTPPTAWRWRFDADAELLGLSGWVLREEGRPSEDAGRRGAVWEGLACISPLAVAILLVNEETAQPAQPVSF